MAQSLSDSSHDDNSLQLTRWKHRWTQSVTLVILVNLLLVIFNLTYLPLRSVYATYFPHLVRVYDPVKGVIANPVTEAYLDEIAELRSHIRQTGLASEQTQRSLANLQQQSTALIENNLFQNEQQAFALAQLERRIQQLTGANSTRAAFEAFWQAEYIQQNGWQTVDAFLQTRIEPLLAQSYYRETLPLGSPTDHFWRIDLPFILFFGLELLIRTWMISRHNPRASWGKTLLRHWYELPLILPFWRLLRIIPAIVHLQRSHFVNVAKLLGQVTHEPAAYACDRLAQYIILRLINQGQIFIRQGAILDVWRKPDDYTLVDNVDKDPDKVDQVSDRLLRLVVMRVMPTVRPDLEKLLRHSLQRALIGSDLYDGLRQLPGFMGLPEEALDGIASYLSEATCEILASSYADDEGRLLLDQLSHDFRHALAYELRTRANSDEVRILLADLLEEFKVNYIQKPRMEDPEVMLQEVELLQQKA
ncbi:hypothetical protein PN498_08605 [Oscillatoria sp. CS-180]|uniref:hypothetical protein n=1 Tax=Oscillatoria sp. CS-180 TaxID=3021720 RepID=UPI00232E2264|nr:hypothetical protein [Oscillatoria sp. CS-180]MDB9526044.1 hypothetical protein [Oscillatoria sp. CS-180]